MHRPHRCILAKYAHLGLRLGMADRVRIWPHSHMPGHLVAEHMRVMFKPSEALEQDPRSEGSARALRADAEALLHQRAPNSGSPGRESTHDSSIVLDWR